MSIIVEPDLWYGAPFDDGVGQQSPMWFDSIGTGGVWSFSSADFAGVDYIGGNLRVPRVVFDDTNFNGDGSGTFPVTPIVPGSVHLECGIETVTDDGEGSLTGDVSVIGTIDYATGAWSFTSDRIAAPILGRCLAESGISAPALPSSLSFAWEVIEPTFGPFADFIFYYTLDNGEPQTTNLGPDPASGVITVTIPSGTQSFSWGVYSEDWDGVGQPAIYDGIVAIGEVPPPPLQYGTVINIVEKDVLDSFFSSWTLASTRIPSETLDYYKSYAMDPNDPLAFWLWPRGYEGADVIVTYASIPAAVTAVGDVLTLSDMYISALVDYCAYRTLSKDARAGAKVIAEKYRESFLLRLGASRQILRQIGQNAARAPDAEA